MPQRRCYRECSTPSSDERRALHNNTDCAPQPTKFRRHALKTSMRAQHARDAHICTVRHLSQCRCAVRQKRLHTKRTRPPTMALRGVHASSVCARTAATPPHRLARVQTLKMPYAKRYKRSTYAEVYKGRRCKYVAWREAERVRAMQPFHAQKCAPGSVIRALSRNGNAASRCACSSGNNTLQNSLHRMVYHNSRRTRHMRHCAAPLRQRYGTRHGTQSQHKQLIVTHEAGIHTTRQYVHTRARCVNGQRGSVTRGRNGAQAYMAQQCVRRQAKCAHVDAGYATSRYILFNTICRV